MRLGKQGYLYDTRTLRIGDMLAPAVPIPVTWDFDKGRAAFPVSSWGNDVWGDCVLAGRANQTLRQQRIESRRTLPMSPDQVIAEYKHLSGAQSAGDANDVGLVVLESLRAWRTQGWSIRKTAKASFSHVIEAYGELNVHDKEQLRTAAFLLDGIHLGLWLPLTARGQFRSNQSWDLWPGDAPETQPGSWGGHLVYTKRFDSGGFYVMTWGREHYVTNAFIDRYCDEAWATVDALDSNSRWLDVPAMIDHLRAIGARAVE